MERKLWADMGRSKQLREKNQRHVRPNQKWTQTGKSGQFAYCAGTGGEMHYAKKIEVEDHKDKSAGDNKNKQRAESVSGEEAGGLTAERGHPAVFTTAIRT